MMQLDLADRVLNLNWQRLRPPLILGLVLILALATGPLQDKIPPLLLLAVPLLPMALIAALSIPLHYLVLAIPLSAILIGGYPLPSKLTVPLLLTIGVVGLWFLRMLLADRRLRFVRTDESWLLGGFAIILCISLVWSNFFRDPLVFVWADFPLAQVGSFVMMAMLIASYYLVVNFLRDIKWLRVLWLMMIISGLVYSVGLFLHLPTIYLMGVSGVWPMWVAALAYAQLLYNNSLKLWQTSVLVLVVALMLQRFFFAPGAVSWISGWFPMISAMVIMTLIRSRTLFMLLILGVLVFVAANADFLYEKILVDAEEDGSYERLELWQTNIDLVSKHWLFGTGPAGYAVYYMAYNSSDARSTHNNYFDILSQFGIPGFLLYIGFFISMGWIAWQTKWRLAGRRDFAEGLINGVLGAWPGVMAAMMLGDWIIPFAYNGTIAGFGHAVYTWMFLGVIVVMNQIYPKKSAGEAAPASAISGENVPLAHSLTPGARPGKEPILKPPKRLG